MNKHNGVEGFELLIKQNDTPDKWTLESFKISNEFVYKGIKDGEELPESYVEKAREIVLERIALAGRRLADILVTCYENYNASMKKSVKKVE